MPRSLVSLIIKTSLSSSSSYRERQVCGRPRRCKYLDYWSFYSASLDFNENTSSAHIFIFICVTRICRKCNYDCKIFLISLLLLCLLKPFTSRYIHLCTLRLREQRKCSKMRDFKIDPHNGK